MSQENDALAALGIGIVTEADHPEVHAECVRAARRLRASGRQVIGLLPASAEVGVPAIGVQLGLSLAHLSGRPVAFVDANVRWPAISARAPIPGDEANQAAADIGFTTRWIGAKLALLAPPRAHGAGAGLPQLERAIAHGSDRFGHMLVDLTGYKKLGEHLAAIALTDGVVVVARAGTTRELELLRIGQELPQSHHLGVVLTGSVA